MGFKEDLERLELQERELVLPRFDAQVAWELGTRVRQLAVERGLSLVVDVRRPGQQLFYTALEGTTADNPEWVRRKINVVMRFQRSSYAVGLRDALQNETIYERQGLLLGEFATHGGCFPLRVENAGLVGTITVSGLPQRSDHEMVVEAICGHLGKSYESLKLDAEE